MAAVNPTSFGRKSLDFHASRSRLTFDDLSGALRVFSRWSVFVWVVSSMVQIFACTSLLYFAEMKPTCVRDLNGKTELSVYQRLTPEIVDTLCSGAFVTVFLAHPHRYVARSRQHFWTACFACVAFISSWASLLQTVQECGSQFIFGTMRLPALFSALVSFVILFWLCLLKVRSVAAIAPSMVRVSEISAIVSVAACFSASILVFMIPQSNDERLFWLLFWLTCVLWLFIILGSVTFFFAVIFVLSRAGRSAVSEAIQEDVDEKTSCQIKIATKWTIITAITIAVAGATFLTFIITFIFALFLQAADVLMAARILRCVDAVTNKAAALFLSGMLDTTGEVMRTSTHLQQVAASIHSQRRRNIQERLQNEVGASTGSALTIIALMDGVDPDTILEDAVSRFRRVSWKTLATRPDIIVGGGPLDVLGPGGKDLHSLSEPCQLGACDVFLSHSWHDDPSAKWEALTSWSENFLRTEGRYPFLWVDKVCLDQTNITKDLRNLPVFLAGCNRLLVLHGPTFTTRLWCSMELLVYKAMFESDETRRPPELLSLGNSQQREINLRAWSSYNVHACECFDKEDKHRFLNVVSQYPGGAEGFNHYMREIVKDLQ